MRLSRYSRMATSAPQMVVISRDLSFQPFCPDFTSQPNNMSSVYRTSMSVRDDHFLESPCHLSWSIPLYQGSVECRLLTSVFYDFGKEISQRCPSDPDLKNRETKAFFDRSVKQFLLEFPRLVDEADARKALLDHGSCRVTLETFVKISARNGFHSVTRKYAQPKQSSKQWKSMEFGQKKHITY